MLERRGGLTFSAVDTRSKCPGQDHCVVFLELVLCKDPAKVRGDRRNILHHCCVVMSCCKRFVAWLHHSASCSRIHQRAQHCCNVAFIVGLNCCMRLFVFGIMSLSFEGITLRRDSPMLPLPLPFSKLLSILLNYFDA